MSGTIGAAAAGLGWLRAHGVAGSERAGGSGAGRRASRGIAVRSRGRASARCSAEPRGQRVHGPERRARGRRPSGRRSERHRRPDRRQRAADSPRRARAGFARAATTRSRPASPAATTTNCCLPCRAARAAGCGSSSGRRAGCALTRIGELTERPATRHRARRSRRTAARRIRPLLATSRCWSLPHPVAGSSSCCTPTTRRSGPRRRTRWACSSGFLRCSGSTPCSAWRCAFIFNLNRVAVRARRLLEPAVDPAGLLHAGDHRRAPPSWASTSRRGRSRKRCGRVSAASWGEFAGLAHAPDAADVGLRPRVDASARSLLAAIAYRVSLVDDPRAPQAHLAQAGRNRLIRRQFQQDTPQQYGFGPFDRGGPARYSGQRPPAPDSNLMFLSRSTGRKIVATTTAAVTFALLYEVTTLDSRYAARQAEVRESSASPAPGARLRFTATGYCKGTTTASGVNVRTGIAAADPDLLRSARSSRSTGWASSTTASTRSWTPARGAGPPHRHLHVELQRGAGARAPRACRSPSCASAGTPRPARPA